MGRSKYIAFGDSKRTFNCTVCGKTYKGDARNVNKLTELHIRLNHEPKKVNVGHVKRNINAVTRQIIAEKICDDIRL